MDFAVCAFWSISSLREIETRVANPIFRSILRSRVDWIVSDQLALISYIGRRSGQRYTFPVVYHHLDGAIIVATPEEATNWWKNFQYPRECHVWLRGEEYNATGEVVTDEERESLLAGYTETHGLLGRMLGVGALSDEPSQSDEPDHGVAVVRFVIGSNR